MGGGTEVKREDCQREESRVRKGTLEEVWGRHPRKPGPSAAHAVVGPGLKGTKTGGHHEYAINPLLQ